MTFDIPEEQNEEVTENNNTESQEVVFNDPEVQNQFFPSEENSESTETINIEEQPVNNEETVSDNSNNELEDVEEDDIWKF